MPIFFIIVFSILSLVYGYIGWRLIPPVHLPAAWNGLAWAALVIFLILPFLPIILRFMGHELARSTLLAWIAYASLGFFFLLFTVLLLRDLGWLFATGAQKLITLVRAGTLAGDAVASDPERRRFILQMMNLGLVGITGALTGYGIFEARRRPAIVEVTIPIRNLPPDLQGFRIVQISDLHVGLTVRRDWLQTVVEMTRALQPDLIAFTGDLADGSVAHLQHDVAPLAELSAPHGCYFVTGNHEYYSGAKAWVAEVQRLGFTVLMNEHRVVQRGNGRILLAGITDYSGGQFVPEHASSPKAAFAGAPPCDAKILLAHQPRSVFAAAPLGFDLQISGHTHGGQFWPWKLVVPLEQPYVAGLHHHRSANGAGWIYISRGTGYWGPPIRLGARSEITVITLTA